MTRSDPCAEPLREVGGFRVVRTLSTSQRGVRLLVHDDTQPWVARVFSRDCPDDVIDRDVAVSDVVCSTSGPLREHVSVVHDLCTTADGRVVLIEEYLPGPRLDTLLDLRHGTWRLGEAVTVLAPLASAIDEGHGLGVTGLLRSPAAVRLRASGAPVLTRRSTALMGPALPARFREREDRYIADREALESVGSAVAAAIGGDDGAALVTVLRRGSPALDHAFFDLAPPLPVQCDPEPEMANRGLTPVRSPTSVATALRLGAPEENDNEPLPLAELRARVTATLLAWGVTASLASAVQRAAESLAHSVARAASVVAHASERFAHRSVRPRFVIAAAGGVLALVTAIVISVQPGAAPSGAAVEGGPVRDSESAEAPQTPGRTEAPRALVGLAETELHPEPEVWPDVIDELVGRWISCVPAESPHTVSDHRMDDVTAVTRRESCAESVAHAGSAAAALMSAADPRHDLLRDWRRQQGEVVVVERMGAAVLIDLVADTTTTASLLVVRSEAGWRIRDVIG